MPPAHIRNVAMVDYSLKRPERLQRVQLASTSLPVFSEAEHARLQGTAPVTVTSEDGREWRELSSWLEDASQITVQCRRAGLTLVIETAAQPQVNLLPLASEPTAQVAWKAGAEIKTLATNVVLDIGRRMVKLFLPFPDTSEGRELYSNVVTAMTTPGAEAIATLTCPHTYGVRHAAPGPRPDRVVIDRLPRVFLRDPRLLTVRAVDPSAVRMATVEARQPAAMRVASMAVMNRADVLRSRIVRAPVIFEPLPAGQPTVGTVALTDNAAFPLLHSRDDENVFPDLPRQAQKGWGQVPGREGRPPLHFRDSDRADMFFYLPTAFRLGFASEDGGGGRPPMRAECYLSDTGEYRVKVTLVALPCISDEDRAALRTYLTQSVLRNTVPFVRLTPAAGLTARFLPDFVSGPAESPDSMPAGIRFSALEAAADRWLVVQFDMDAQDYPILAEMLRKGLRGRVVLDADGISQGIAVWLDLQEIIGDGLDVRQQDSDLWVDNVFDLPVTLSSVRVALLDTGSVPGLIFDVEEQDLLPGAGQRLPGKSNWSARVEPARVTGWDETVVSLGPVRVEGGTPQEWLDRVNRDPSLRPQPFRLKLLLTVPSLAADRFELLQLRLWKADETSPRDELRMLPGSPPVELAVRVTLADLMQDRTQADPFYVEYETLHKDGTLGLAQRLTVRPGQVDTSVVALVEAPGLAYTVDYRTAEGPKREEVDRAAAAQLVARLKQAGARWQIYARQPATPTPPVGPTPSPDPVEPAPSGPEVQILTDLLQPAFAAGSISKVFVVLRPRDIGAPSSTLVIDAPSQGGVRWRPAGGTVPPFHYQVTYLMADGTSRRVEGDEATLTLLLDVPA